MVAAAVIGGAIIGGVASNQSSKRASGASGSATRQSIDEQGRQYDQTRQDFAPTRQLGTSAINTLNRLYGYAQAPTEAQQQAMQPLTVGDTQLPPGVKTIPLGGGRYNVTNPDGTSIGTLVPGGPNGRFLPNGTPIAEPVAPPVAAGQGTPGTPDLGAFFESPDYQYNLQQQEKAIGRRQAAGGTSLSGRAYSEIQRNASGAASGQYSDFTNRLLAMAGLGQAATSATAGAGTNAANLNSQALLQNGQNRANLAIQNGANINNAAQSGISNLMLYKYLNPSATAAGG